MFKTNTSAFGTCTASDKNGISTYTASSSSSASGYNCFETQALSESIACNIINQTFSEIVKNPISGNVQILLNTHYSTITDDFTRKLPILELIDLTDTKTYTQNIINTHHSFYNNYPSKESSTFGSGESSPNSYLLPIFKLKRGQLIKLNMRNLTDKYTFNTHFHGLNNNAFADGASGETVYGLTTKIGIENKLVIPINNNASVLFYHPHNMFEASPFLYLGMFGGILITDEQSMRVDDNFIYGDNYLVLITQDIDFDKMGVIDQSNLYTFNWEGNYSLLNGISCVGWNDTVNESYINKLYHIVQKSSIVKITLLNGSSSNRQFNVGVCDKNNNIKHVYFVETDQGYRNPLYTKIVPFSPSTRVSIMFDLNEFPDKEAYLFYYNFDLTFNNGLIYNSDISKDLLNPLNTTPETYDVYPNGIEPVPSNFSIIKFLKLNYNNQNIVPPDVKFETIITNIEKLVFGKHYNFVKSLTVPVENLNYGKYLNTSYFYNLPNFFKDVPLRNLLLFYDTEASKANGATEFITSGANRIMCDMWNSEEYSKYVATKKNIFLPTCLFSISKYTGNYLEYSNYQMLDNHLLYVNIYKHSNKIARIKIEFPESDEPMNIVAWSALVNKMYSMSSFNDSETTIKLSDILEYVWEPYLYKFTYLENQSSSITVDNKYYKSPTIIKNVRILNKNLSSEYDIELEAPYTLLTFFGKPFTGMQKTHNMNETKHIDSGIPMNNLQQIFPYAGTRSGEMVPAINNTFNLKILSNETYYGFCDGFNNDNFRNMSVKKNNTEKWRYHNGDDSDFHPLHFHLTSGYILNEDQETNSKLLAPDTLYFKYLYYSKDDIAIPPQSSVTFRLKFANYSSEEGPIKFLGYMFHCHLMAHHDMNMMSQYFVYSNKSTYFY